MLWHGYKDDMLKKVATHAHVGRQCRCYSATMYCRRDLGHAAKLLRATLLHDLSLSYTILPCVRRMEETKGGCKVCAGVCFVVCP